MQSKLKQFAKVLGYEGSEIFPKQTEILVDRGDTGNFLNLPYHNEMKGLSYAIDDNGCGCTLEEFYQLYDVYSCTKETIEKIKTEEKKIVHRTNHIGGILRSPLYKERKNAKE